ncbi:hypothetical protein pb186bvf_012218 [Paramecium bursaria]
MLILKLFKDHLYKFEVSSNKFLQFAIRKFKLLRHKCVIYIYKKDNPRTIFIQFVQSMLTTNIGHQI